MVKIAISGPMCSGKSTIAKYICSLNPDYKIYSFGQKIKDIAKELFDMGDIKDRSLLIDIANVPPHENSILYFCISGNTLYILFATKFLASFTNFDVIVSGPPNNNL